MFDNDDFHNLIGRLRIRLIAGILFVVALIYLIFLGFQSIQGAWWVKIFGGGGLIYLFGKMFFQWFKQKYSYSFFEWFFGLFRKRVLPNDFFPGVWQSEYQESGQLKSGAEKIEIKNKFEWWENDDHIWEIKNFKVSNKLITFTKTDPNNNHRKKENVLLIKYGGEYYSGLEGGNTNIEYKIRLDKVVSNSKSSTLLANPPVDTNAPFGRDPLGNPLNKDGNTAIRPLEIITEPIRTI